MLSMIFIAISTSNFVSLSTENEVLIHQLKYTGNYSNPSSWTCPVLTSWYSHLESITNYKSKKTTKGRGTNIVIMLRIISIFDGPLQYLGCLQVLSLLLLRHVSVFSLCLLLMSLNFCYDSNTPSRGSLILHLPKTNSRYRFAYHPCP